MTVSPDQWTELKLPMALVNQIKKRLSEISGQHYLISGQEKPQQIMPTQ